MKVYEKLGLPYLTAEQFAGIRTGCPKNSHPEYRCNNDTCTECYYNYLNSEVSTKKVKRWETYNRDFIKAFSDYLGGIHNAKHSPEIIGRDFVYWLVEEIEVEE